MADGRGHSGSSYVLNSISAWTENVRIDEGLSSVGRFTACYSYSGNTDHHNDNSKTKINLHFVAYQRNIHRRMAHVEGDQIPLATWKRGAQCVKAKTKVDVY